jgi:hypothetical protein
MEDLHRGLVHDIKEDRIIVVLTTEDPHGYPFCIAKVINIDNGNEDVIEIEVHWYAIGTHTFNGVYNSKMMVEKHVNRKSCMVTRNEHLTYI